MYSRDSLMYTQILNLKIFRLQNGCWWQVVSWSSSASFHGLEGGARGGASHAEEHYNRYMMYVYIHVFNER